MHPKGVGYDSEIEHAAARDLLTITMAGTVAGFVLVTVALLLIQHV